MIQGSANVYSKKVEHLYNLVYQALEYITTHKKRDEAALAARGGGARSGAGSSADDDGDLAPLDAAIESLFLARTHTKTRSTRAKQHSTAHTHMHRNSEHCHRPGR